MRRLVVLGLALFAAAAPLSARTAQIWMDTSGSVNREISASTEEFLANLLTHSRGIDRVEVFGFASGLDSLRTPTAAVALPQVQDAPSCKARKRELALRALRKQHEEECEAQRLELQAVRERELAAVSRRLVGHFQSVEARPPYPSTCLLQVLLRTSMQPPDQISIVLSDGDQYNCEVPPKPPSAGGTQVIVLLVPKKGDDERAITLMEERAKRIKAYAPRTVVLPLFRMETDLPGLVGK